VSTVKPAEVYYLAAYHSSSEGPRDALTPSEYQNFHNVHVQGLLHFLCAIHEFSPSSRIFYAGTSLLFDGSNGSIQDETTSFSPIDFYGLTKAQGVEMCRHFRRNYGVFACVGILYSHESAYRPEGFLSKRLIKSAYEISIGVRSELLLGSLTAANDWGFASDFVSAFRAIMSLDYPDDFIVATGESHSVAEFAEVVFDCFGLDWTKFVRQDSSKVLRSPILRIGDFSKLRSSTGWAPRFTFRQMVERLVADYLSWGV
jgi:GDPmannose 4,6-dehydratase